jgi:hypothetical protein
MKRHSELEIKTLQNAPRDAAKLRRLLEIKQRQKEEAMHIEDTQRLVREIEMLKVVLYLVRRKQQNSSKRQLIKNLSSLIVSHHFFYLFSQKG